MLVPQVERQAFEAQRPFLTEAMRRVAGPVSVITAGIGDDRTGATVTTAQSLSIEPESMMVAINLGSSTFPVISRHNHYCVNVLRADQQPVADRFAGRGGLKGRARYEGARWEVLETGALALDGALASIDCAVEDIILRHSHALILGRVMAVVLGDPGSGLVYRDGAYWPVGPG
ncbi:MAG: flavin reductase family protein [Rhizobiaceae bacterium]|nr:flavin reductase family protein [Rhizobiaceae bacterium]